MDWLTADSQLLDLLPVGVYVCEAPSGRILRYNRRAVELWGREPALGESGERFCGSYRLFRRDGTFIAHGDAPIVECLQAGTSYQNLEAVIERPDGSRAEVLVSINPLRDATGAVIGAVNVFQDISERVAAERVARQLAEEQATLAALRRSEEQYRILFEENPQPMWVFDPESFAFLAVNEAAIRHYGYSRDEFLGMTIEEIRPPDEIPQLRARVSQHTFGYEPLGEWRHRKRDGTIIDVDIHAHTISFEGRPAHLVMANDVTARRQAERELQRSEARFQTFMEHRPTAEWITDAEGRIVYVSPAYRRTFLVMDDLVGKTVWDLYPPEFAAEYVGNIRQVAASGRVVETLELAPRPDGSTGKFIVYKFPLESDGEQLVGGVAIDVTERDAAAQALRESEERLRLALEAGETGIWDWDIVQDCVIWSEQVYRFHGLTPEAFGGSVADFAALIHPEDRDRVQEAIRAALEEGAPFQIEFRILRPNGEIRWLTTTGKVHFDADGRPVRMLGANQDITERRRLEEELRSSEAQFRGLVEQSPLSIQVLSPTGQTLQVNQAWERLWGASLEQLQATDYNLLRDPQLERKGVMPEIRRAFAGEAVSLPPVDYNRAESLPELLEDEEPTRWVRANIYPVRDPEGVIRKVVLVHEDYTQRKLLEDALARRVQELAEADRRKDEFLAMLAHELRNPLAPIVNALQLQRLREKQGEVAPPYREVIERNVQHLARLVDDLLEVSRITQDKIELRPQRLELGSVLSLAEAAVEGLVARKRQQLRVSAPERPIYLEADSTRLVQVLVNLLTNAAKYTPEGGQLSVTASQEGAEAVISVRDTGIGIEPDLLPRVFDLFVQGERSLARTEGGLGIGLTLVKRLVELHGGTVTAHSEGAGRGSEFVVRLPAVADVSEAPATPCSSSEPASRLQVLVVEDNADAADTLAELLTIWSHEVRVAHEGHAALAVAAEFQPHVVLLDIGLPGLDGYEVARRLRALPGLEQTVLFALTGYGQEEDRRRSEAAGCDRHLTKPVDAEALRGLLGTLTPRPPLPRCGRGGVPGTVTADSLDEAV